MLLVIDNYDSFTYNLVQYLGELGVDMKVIRNDKISIDGIKKLRPSSILISPGPCTPTEAGVSVETVKTFSGEIPILGVCLGHQSIGQAFGGIIEKAPEVMHGKVSPVYHNNDSLFKGIPSPFNATRYHSLVIRPDSLPSCLTEIANSGEVIMAVKHKKHPTWGVQFHPESILTEYGKELLSNFLSIQK